MYFKATGQRVLDKSKHKAAEPSPLNAALDTAKQTMELISSFERWSKNLASSRKTQTVAVLAAVGVGLYWLNQRKK